MTGGLTQLIAYGAQDVYLTGNPQFTFFKALNQRCTNFALESIEQTVMGSPSSGGQSVVEISRNGDLVNGIWFEITMTKNGTSTYPAEAFIKNIELEIGGQRIDYIDSDWMAVRRELFFDNDEREAYYEMNNFRVDDPDGLRRTFFVKPPFYFNSGDPSKALPLIALQYHEVKLIINFNTNIPGISTTDPPSVRVYADYVFLDTKERTWFAQKPHEYIMEQLQIQDMTTPLATTQKSYKVQLNFNHPTRYLIWCGLTSVHGAFSASQNPFEANDNYSPYSKCKIMFNGIDRFSERQGAYFRFVQPFTTLQRTPSAGVYMYSFGLDDTTNKNTGTMNFSRVDTATLLLTTKAATASSISTITNTDTTVTAALTAFSGAKVFGVNYNVLRVMSGMAGLAYAN